MTIVRRDQVRGLTDNNNINYRAEPDRDRPDTGSSQTNAINHSNKSSSLVKTQFDRDLERDRDRDIRDRDRDRDRDSVGDRRSVDLDRGSDRESGGCSGGGGGAGSGSGGRGDGMSVRRSTIGGDEQSIQDLKDFKERERDREMSTTPVDHTPSGGKRRRKNSTSNCDNSLTSTHSANLQERNYSQDSQVRAKCGMFSLVFRILLGIL